MAKLLYSLVIAIGAIWGGWLLASMGCEVRWPAQLSPRLIWAVGCTVEVNGLRIPDTAYRVS